MSSRQEEKQRRREERLAREKAEKASAARRQRLRMAGGALLGVAIIAGVVLVAIGAIGGSKSSGNQHTPSASVELPAQQIGDLNAAAKAAGCKVSNPAIEGRNHESKDFKASDYKTNPPTSGNHFPEWYQDGVYAPGDTPNLGMLVHTLEHGRIDVQYKPGTPTHTVSQLESLLAEQSNGYHMLLFQNATNMNAQIAATAWGHSLTCPQFNNQVFDALRTFRDQYIDKGPETVN